AGRRRQMTGHAKLTLSMS
ncbi:hypothetical protein AB1N83_012157, partial [Pleurotus pulmonarius]